MIWKETRKAIRGEIMADGTRKKTWTATQTYIARGFGNIMKGKGI
jgi:hypothetical protein